MGRRESRPVTYLSALFSRAGARYDFGHTSGLPQNQLCVVTVSFTVVSEQIYK